MSSDLLSWFRHTKDTVTFAVGETIFEEGQFGDKMYIIQEGTVEIYAHGKLVETAQTGTAIGEMALIDNEPRSASAIAKTEARLVPIDQKRFIYMVQETPNFALAVMHIMAQRLRANHQ
jgi:CRP/FNR family cyclic AMP-dependent transcriptional regulator